MANILVKGGTVIDGTGAPSFKADVRIRGNKITEMGADLPFTKDERLVDATGCYVTPGFIESHTHYDATMWWQPDLDPLPGYGISTIVMGNCGFSAAPISDDPVAQMEMIKIFSFFEDIPIGPFQKFLPWDWRKWSEYKESLTSKVKVPANIAAYVGHIAIRLTVMGTDAWTRVATAEEISKMALLLEDALAAGALGLSTNLLDYDGEGRAIPTLISDDAEFTALFEILERYPGSTLQFILDSSMRKTAPELTERMLRLAKGRGMRIQVTAFPNLDYQSDMVAPLKAIVDKARSEGEDVWHGFAHIAPTIALSLLHSLLFAQSGCYVWHEVVLAESKEEKLKILNDPDWRARARENFAQGNDVSFMKNPEKLSLRNSENGIGPVNLTLKDYADEIGKHPSDAMADWFIINGLESTIHMAPAIKDEDLTVELMNDPMTVGNFDDAPAHAQMFCGAGENLRLFTEYVADGRITIEHAIHLITGKAAGFFNFEDRGVLREGKRADVVIFNMDEIDRREEYKRYDVPTGDFGVTWRYTRDAAPMRMTIVNGLPTFADGRFTGGMSGEFVSPSSGSDLAQAAE